MWEGEDVVGQGNVVGCGDVRSCNTEIITGDGVRERSLCGIPVTTCGMVNRHDLFWTPVVLTR